MTTPRVSDIVKKLWEQTQLPSDLPTSSGPPPPTITPIPPLLLLSTFFKALIHNLKLFVFPFSVFLPLMTLGSEGRTDTQTAVPDSMGRSMIHEFKSTSEPYLKALLCARCRALVGEGIGGGHSVVLVTLG